MKTIGVLTSGGDAPGMNACIATIAQSAEARGVKLRGVFYGFQGLVEGNSIPIGSELSGLARRGGTFLGTSRNGNLEDALQGSSFADILSRCGVDGLIVLGGGGSLTAAARLAESGAPIVGIPSTIDNDVLGTEYTLGFDSAVNKAVRIADEMMDTAESLSGRIFVLETLGGVTGHIALATAYAVGADAALIHELPIDIDAVARDIKAKMDNGATHGLVVLCEGLGTADISLGLEDATGRRTRITVLGHAQRGGSPTYLDRMLGREFGEAAVELLLAGESGKMVNFYCGRTDSVPLAQVADKPKQIDMMQYRAVNDFLP